MQFQDDGNVLLLECADDEDVHDGQASITDDPNDQEWIVQTAIEIVAKVDSSGLLYFTGSVFDNEYSLAPSANAEFVVQDADGDAVAIIDAVNGNLKVRGEVYTIDGAYDDGS